MSITKKDEDIVNSYYNDKSTIIQEARVFNESPISPRKCRALLTRIVYLLYVGESFGTQEATTLFFGTTKLFQHKDVRPSGNVRPCASGLTFPVPRARCARWST
jgi:coatomer protein complex subunit gamma